MPLLDLLRASAISAGAELGLVGGPVRDAALGRKWRDLDLVCWARTAALVTTLQDRLGTGGFRFRKRGVTTWRFSVDGETIDIVDAARRGLPADLARRDFRINAIAWDLHSGRLHDPHRGLSDLRRGRLRLPSPEAMNEDPLRVLRAARFVAELPGFHLDGPAQTAAREAAPGLPRSAVERQRDELDKLLASPAPVAGLRLLDQLGATSLLLPELDGLGDCVAGADRPDVWTHTLDVLAISTSAGRRRLPGHRSLADADPRLALRWSILLHDISKPETLAHRADGRPTFHGHESLGARRSDALLRRLRQPKELRRRVTTLVRLHLRPSQLAESGASSRGCRRLVRDAADDLPLLLVHAGCDALGSGGPPEPARWARLRRLLGRLATMYWERLEEPPTALVTGGDVKRICGLPQGPRIGALLETIRDEQESGRLQTRSQALERLKELAGG